MEPTMELSEFALRLLLLFLPGIICWQTVDALTVHRKRSSFDIIIQSFLFGLAGYFFTWLIIRIGGPPINRFVGTQLPTRLIFLHALQDRTARLSFGEIGLVCGVAFLQGLAWSAADNHKLLHNCARKLRISKRSGELDVWGIVFNATRIQYATVRDYKHDLVFDGWVEFFSDDAKTSELFLRDVAVHRNSSGQLMYSVGGLYICIDPKEMGIEFRDIPLTSAFQPQQNDTNAQRAPENKPAESRQEDCN
jgi:hypothetical protein